VGAGAWLAAKKQASASKARWLFGRLLHAKQFQAVPSFLAFFRVGKTTSVLVKTHCSQNQCRSTVAHSGKFPE
jgi:hypothetical protein